MAEKQTHSPEADPQTIDDLYRQAADCLETWLHYNEAEVSPSSINPHLLEVKAKMPEFNGRTLELEYERPCQEDDPTQVDREYPLIWDNAQEKNQWYTWIGIKVFDSEGSLIHDIDLGHSNNDVNGKSTPGMVYDKHLQPWQDPEDDNTAPVSMVEAKNLIGHMEWAADQLLDQHPEDQDL